MDLIEQLKRDEGLRLTPYIDTVGKITIGYGTNLSDGIDTDEAEYLFRNRLNKKRIELARALPWMTQLDEPRQAVLINMAYNMGVGSTSPPKGLLSFRNTLDLIRSGDYVGAANNMMQSKWADQVGIRAVRLARQMAEGKWQ